MATRKTLAYLSVVALLAASVSAEPVYVNSVAALTNAVATATDGATIVLRATGEPYTFTDEWMDASGTVKSMLKINASNITIEGEDSSSRKTWTTGSEPVIIDANGLGRIVQVVSKRTGVTFKNITFTGGNASGDYGGGMNGSDDKTLPVCTNCVFRGNTATKQGSAVFYCNLQDCLVANNTSQVALYAGMASECDIVGSANGVAQVTSLGDCRIVNNVVPANGAHLVWGAGTYSNCVFRHNSVNRSIVLDAKLMIGCTFEDNTNAYGTAIFTGIAATNCTFRRNHSTSGTSYLTSGFRSLSGCTFEKNYVGYAGVLLNVNGIYAEAVGCTFVSNTAYFAGGTPGCGAAIRILRDSSKDCRMTVTNCVFVGNTASSSGGAIYATNTRAGEAPWEGCDVFDCSFVSNRAYTIAGACGVRAVGCTFDGNVKSGSGNDGNAAANSFLKSCDINDAELANCTMDRCRIHHVTNNVHCIFYGMSYVTNTLVEYCAPNSSYASLVRPTADAFGSDFVNCTFATNKFYTYLVSAASYTATPGISFVNCLFYGTEQGQGNGYTDIDYRPTDNSFPTMFEYVTFSHTYYGRFASSRLSAADLATKTGDGLLMQCENPGFSEIPEWSLSLKSDILGKGDASIWTDGDIDLAGKPRLKEGLVDPGCYQCWQRTPGMMMIVK